MSDVQEIKKKQKYFEIKIDSIDAKLSSENSLEVFSSTKQIAHKFKYTIPFETLDEFKQFDADLLRDSNLQNAVVRL